MAINSGDIRKKNQLELPFMKKLLLKVFPGQRIARDIEFARNILSGQANQLKTTQLIIKENQTIFQGAAESLGKNLEESTNLSTEAQQITDALLSGQDITGKQAILLQDEMKRVLGEISSLDKTVSEGNDTLGVSLGSVLDEFSSLIFDQNTNADMQQKLFKDAIRVAERNGVEAEAIAQARAVDFKKLDLSADKDRDLLKQQLEQLRDISQGIEVSGESLEAIRDSNGEIVTNQEEFEDERNTKSALSGRSAADIAGGGLGAITQGIGGGLLTNALNAAGFGSIAALVESTGLGPSLIAAVTGGIGLLSKGISKSVGGIFSTARKLLPGRAIPAAVGGAGAGKAPKSAKGGGFSIGRFAKLAAKGFLVLNVLTSISDFLDGFSNAGELLGKAQENLTLFDKVFAGIAKFIEAFTFGLISAEDIVSIDMEAVKTAFGKVTQFFKDIGAFILPLAKDIGSGLISGAGAVVDGFKSIMNLLFGEDGVLNFNNILIKIFDSLQETLPSFLTNLIPASFSDHVADLKKEKEERKRLEVEKTKTDVAKVVSISAVDTRVREESDKNLIQTRQLQEKTASVASVLPAIATQAGGQGQVRTSEGVGNTTTVKPIDGDVGLATMVANLLDR